MIFVQIAQFSLFNFFICFYQLLRDNLGRHFKPLNGNVKSQYCIFVLFFGQRFFNVWLFSFHRRIVHCAVGLLLLHGNNTYWMNLFCQAGNFLIRYHTVIILRNLHYIFNTNKFLKNHSKSATFLLFFRFPLSMSLLRSCPDIHFPGHCLRTH